MNLNAIKNLSKTNSSISSLVLRITLAITIFPHGAQKLFGWFGGYGFENTLKYFTETMELPWIIGCAVILLESIGALLLLIGFETRITAILYTILAIGIIFSSHIQNGFFMNWFANQSGEGYEYFILWIGISSSLFLLGAGKYSIDQLMKARK